MTSKASVEAFVRGKTFALVGASASGKRFGCMAIEELRKRGYRVLAVHPRAETIQGEPAFRSLADLPEKVDGVIVVVPPAESEKVVREARDAGIGRAWLQQGAESQAAIEICEKGGMDVVHGECILMFARPVGFLHGMHRWIWGLLGKLPRD